MIKAPTWDLLSPEFSKQEQNMFDERGWFLICNTPAWKQLFLNSVTLYSYDAAYVMDNDNYATVMEGFVIISSL